ncbi:MAG: MBL fold metallo-hydrolase [Syntrophorhabdaceae bacterium]
MTSPRDSAVYLLDLGQPVLIDCGSGFGFDRMVRNIEAAGYDPSRITDLLMTHCHADHIGAAGRMRDTFGMRLVIHEKDAEIVERGDIRLTASFCFDVDFKPLPIDKKLYGRSGTLQFPASELKWVHTPGHTPGSISFYMDAQKTRILFAQDIGAPLLSEFDCDPDAWLISIQRLFALEADILCDGHSGAYGPKNVVRQYLDYCLESQYEQGYLKRS